MAGGNLLRRKPADITPRTALTAAAAAIALDGTSWKNWKLGDQRWQEEGWRHYDICGELRYAANWMGNAVSRCRLYIAELDEAGRPGDEVTEDKIAVIAETMFGGPANKAEAQRLLGVQLYVAGESFIVAESVDNAKEDIWYVCSTSEVRRQGDNIKVQRSHVYGGGAKELEPSKDLLIRAWTPHPRRYDAADSSVRAALPILRELEQLTKKVFAQIDSRLAGAGILFVPSELEFPRGPDDQGGAQGLMKLLERAMSAALQDQSNASALVPIMAQVAGEFVDKIKWQTFETPFQGETLELRKEGIRRLALALDLPPEVLLGQGDSNHWSAWQIEESTIKIQIEPLLARIADALTSAYLRPALGIINIDPEKYTFWYDTSALAIRPDRQADALALWNDGLLDDTAVRKAGNWSEDDALTAKNRERKFAMQLVLASPGLIAAPDVQAAIGIEWDVSGAMGGGEAPAEGEPPPAEEQPETEAPDPRALPEQAEDTTTPAQEAALLIGADMVVRRALELAGKRLLTRERRGQYATVPAWELHTHITVSQGDALRLLSDAWGPAASLADRVGMEPDVMVEMLSTYCTSLISHGEAHDYERFALYVDAALELIGHEGCTPETFCRNPLHPGPCKGWKKKLGGVPEVGGGEKKKATVPAVRKPKKVTTAPVAKPKAPAAPSAPEKPESQKTGGLKKPVVGRDLTTSEEGLTAVADAASAEYRKQRKLSEADPSTPLGMSDWRMNGTAKVQGFDARPQNVTEAELDAAVAAGAIETWRGFSAPPAFFDTEGTGADFAESLRNDDDPFYGSGVYGNGIYVGDDESIAREYGEGTRFGTRGREGGVLVRMAIHPDARIIEWGELYKEHNAWMKENAQRARDKGSTVGRMDTLEGRLGVALADPGRYAMARGYDVIVARESDYKASEGDDSQHFSVLNRSVLIIGDKTEKVGEGNGSGSLTAAGQGARSAFGDPGGAADPDRGGRTGGNLRPDARGGAGARVGDRGASGNLTDPHASCLVGRFCRNPLHPGPCKGWRRQLDVNPGDRKDKMDDVEPPKKVTPPPDKPKPPPRKRVVKPKVEPPAPPLPEEKKAPVRTSAATRKLVAEVQEELPRDPEMWNFDGDYEVTPDGKRMPPARLKRYLSRVTAAGKALNRDIKKAIKNDPKFAELDAEEKELTSRQDRLAAEAWVKSKNGEPSDEAWADWNKNYNRILKIKEDRKRREQEIVREILAEVRPMGGVRHSDARALKDGDRDLGRIRATMASGGEIGEARADWREQLTQAEEMFPEDWLHLSNQDPLLLVTSRRAFHWDPQGKRSVETYLAMSTSLRPDPKDEIRGSYDGAFPTEAYEITTHELGHRMEVKVPGLTALEFAWLRGKATDERGRLEPRQDIYAGVVGEVGYRDKLPDRYTGKSYERGPNDADPADRPWEVFQVGLQDVYGRTKHKFGREDLSEFVLGVLATLQHSESDALDG